MTGDNSVQPAATTAPPTHVLGIEVLAIDHVGIAVPDLDAAIAFHTTVLGGVLDHRETNTEQGVEEAMISYGGGAQLQLLAALTPRVDDCALPGPQRPGSAAAGVPGVRCAGGSSRRQSGRNPDIV